MKKVKDLAKSVTKSVKSDKKDKAKDKKSETSKSSKSKKSDGGKSTKTETSKSESKTNTAFKIGRPTLPLSYSRIIILASWAGIAVFLNILLALELFADAVRIRHHLGRFIDMISKGDGAYLPLFQTMPVLICLLVNCSFVYFIYKIFSKKPRGRVNLVMFVLIMVNLGLLIAMVILLFVIMAHIHGSQEHLHNGISNAMAEYSSNTVYKSLMDRLQIELQCCGSKKYDEWYTVKWFDPSLNSKGDSSATVNTVAEGHTPFSCCKRKTLSPCIHHNIENTARSYLYTPELNLSISTIGCYGRIQEKRKSIGWKIIGNLFLFMLLQMVLLVPLRLLQTAHFYCEIFGGQTATYGWLLGSYKKSKKSDDKTPPTPPPVPPELRE